MERKSSRPFITNLQRCIILAINLTTTTIDNKSTTKNNHHHINPSTTHIQKVTMSAIRLSASALRPVAARRAATPAFTQIRSVSTNGDELGGVQGSEPATRHNRYNVYVTLPQNKVNLEEDEDWVERIGNCKSLERE